MKTLTGLNVLPVAHAILSADSLPVFGDECDIVEWNEIYESENYTLSNVTCEFAEYVTDFGWTNRNFIVLFWQLSLHIPPRPRCTKNIFNT